jgi:hypothetical protein
MSLDPNGIVPSDDPRGGDSTPNSTRLPFWLVALLDDAKALKNTFEDAPDVKWGWLGSTEADDKLHVVLKYDPVLLLRDGEKHQTPLTARLNSAIQQAGHKGLRLLVLPGWSKTQSLASYLGKLGQVQPGCDSPEGLYDWLVEQLGRPNRLTFAPASGDDALDAALDGAWAWPEPPAREVYTGIVGEIVDHIAPETEADPVAVLIQVLIGIGNLIGRSAHMRVESSRHYCNEYAVLVGDSGKARKGTSEDRARAILETVDPDWARKRIKTGLASGEGLIEAVRDARSEMQPVKSKGMIVDYQEVITDHGVGDKRLLVLESEFGRVLRILDREGNILSPILRMAWDGKDLETMRRANATATAPHISLIGHIPADELIKLLSVTEAASGFANRFLWIAVRRSKMLPFGGNALMLGRFRDPLERVVANARATDQMQWSDAAAALWRREYSRLSVGRPGLLGSVINRGEAHVLRLAVLYSLLEDRGPEWRGKITESGLRSALALWDYAERSARFIFGNSLGSPHAEKILEAIKARGSEGMSRMEIRDIFSRHRDSDAVGRDLALLIRHELIVRVVETTKGRPKEIFFSPCAESAERAESTPGTPSDTSRTPPSCASSAYRALSYKNYPFRAPKGGDTDSLPPELPRPESAPKPLGDLGNFGETPESDGPEPR